MSRPEVAAGDVVDLGRRWTVGARLGSGGFGQVFAAADEHGETAVVKVVSNAPGADREALAGTRVVGAANVVPVIDPVGIDDLDGGVGHDAAHEGAGGQLLETCHAGPLRFMA